MHLPSLAGTYARHFTGVGVQKEGLFFERWPSAAVSALASTFPDWNVSACAIQTRHVRMPADPTGTEQGAAATRTAGTPVATRVEYTRHCLERGMASSALRALLWPERGHGKERHPRAHGHADGPRR